MNTIIGENYYAGIKDDLTLNQNDTNIFNKLDWFLEKNKKETKLFFLSYDLKNKIESLESSNKDEIEFPMIRCIIPKKIGLVKDFKSHDKSKNIPLKFKPEISKEEYLNIINQIKHHIQKGDIYETNFCYDWHTKQKVNNPFEIFEKLSKLTKAPFSVYAEIDNHVIISASPERFLKRKGNSLISQPIKGTSKRSKKTNEDNLLIEKLKSDPKERTENIMIVDLVRNDLSKIALQNSVKVEELCKVYTFENIHQMISTVNCKINKNIKFSTILAALFPMGSMTGVPKIKAMELMDIYEKSKRGLYSGAIGVMEPNGDLDFNVIIRTIIYNKENDCLSFKVGGAITINSDPEKEYEETLVKAEALLKACN